MNFTQYTIDLSAQISHISPSSIPSTLWDYYVRYLWYYKPDSAVAKIAYTFRLLAILLIMPVLILILLDVSAYVLARTLGVVDDVKASTSDKGTVHLPHEIRQPPLDTSLGGSKLGAPADDNVVALAVSSPENESNTPVFYAGGDDQSNLQLSGVGVFSPAESTPPSPTITRNQLQLDGKDELRQRNQHQTETEN